MEETPEQNENENLQTDEFTLDIDSKNVFKMILSYGKAKIFFFIESVKQASRYYELSTFLSSIQNQDKNLLLFNSAEKLVFAIKKCIQSKKYKYTFDNDFFQLTIENEFFNNNKASINVPLGKNQNLIDIFLNLKKELDIIKKEKNKLSIKNEELIKEEKIKLAKESFEGSNIVNDEEKILLSEWVDPKIPLKFNLVFSTYRDQTSSASTFHKYCDGVSPTITLVMDTSGEKFGGYTTSNWSESCAGSGYARDQDSFIFNLSRKSKYIQPDKFGKYSIYRNKSYGPTFGGGNNGYNLYLADSCTGNSSSYTCVDPSYNTDNKNLKNSTGQSSFQVSYYEVYRVVSGL